MSVSSLILSICSPQFEIVNGDRQNEAHIWLATLENNKFPTRKGYFLIVLMLINTEVYYSIIAHYRKRRNPLDKNLFLNRLKLLKPPQSDLESTNLLRHKDTI